MAFALRHSSERIRASFRSSQIVVTTGLEPSRALRRSGPRTGSSRAQTPALRGLRPVILLAGVLMTVGALYLGREFLVPLAVAGLLTFVLNPIVRVFERRLPRAAAVVLVVILTFAVLGAFTWALATPGRQPGRGDPELPGQPEAKTARDPWGEPGWRDREGPVGHEGGRRGAPEGGQAGQACREAGARGGEVPGRGLLAASRRPGCARQRGPGARAGDLHAPGAAPAARSSDPADRLRPDCHDHEGHGRGRPADHPLPDHAEPHQWQLRPRRGPGRSADRAPLRVPLGLPGRGPPLHPVRGTLGRRPDRRLVVVWRCSTDGSSRS